MTPKQKKILSEMSHIQNMFIMNGHDIDWTWFVSNDGKYKFSHPENQECIQERLDEQN